MLINKNEPILYTSGRYPSEFEKTTVAVKVVAHPEGRGMLMYDLRTDPADFIGLSAAELAARWSARGEEVPYFPVKLLSYNRSPAVAPLSVLDNESITRLKLDKDVIAKNLAKLRSAKDFGNNLLAALQIVFPKRQPELVIDEQQVDSQLYDGFVSDADRIKMSVVRAAEPSELNDFQKNFSDDRLKSLLPLYKARNFPTSLSATEKVWWQSFKAKRLLSGDEASLTARYFKHLEELSQPKRLSKEQKYLLNELKLYGESILPL